MKQKADWVSWGLHFVFGMVAGLLVGFWVINRRRGRIWLSDDLIFPFLLGCGLILGAVGSWYGDRLWVGSSYRVIPPQGIQHSPASELCSILAGISGSVLVIGSLLLHFSR